MQPQALIGAEIQKPKVKKRILWLSDTPTCATGFAQVARNLLQVLLANEEYEVDVIGINHSDYYDRTVYPYAIHEAAPALTMNPKYRDLFGRQRLLDFLGRGHYDFLFTLQDTFIIEPIAKQILETRKAMREANVQVGKPIFKDFAWVYYYPIDGKPKANWVKDSALCADIPVCYTDWGKEQCLEVLRSEMNQEQRLTELPEIAKRIRVIHHGVNTKEFYPIADRAAVKAFRHDYFQGRADGKFLVVNINRNQPRKDLARTLAIFSKFYETHPKSFLYLHCQAHDVGGNLMEIARNFPNLRMGENWSVPSQFEANQGFPVERINEIYNAADVVLSTTWGEGWGLSYTEAMATKTLVIAPRNTSAPEILGVEEERGLLMKSGESDSAWVLSPGDNEIIRPITDIQDGIAKLTWAYDHRAGDVEYDAKITAAFAFAQAHDWAGSLIGDAWRQVFRDADSLVLREKWVAKIGRNDQCPCGSGKKAKHCHYTNA